MNKVQTICKDENLSTNLGKDEKLHIRNQEQQIFQKTSKSAPSISSSHSQKIQSVSSQSSSQVGQKFKSNGSSKFNPKSFLGSMYNKIDSIFQSIYYVICVVFSIISAPIYYVCKLILYIYGILKPLTIKICEVLAISIKCITTIGYKAISYFCKNPQVIIKFPKIIITKIYLFICFLSNRLIDMVKNQHKNGWPIFNFIRDLDRQQGQIQNQNDYDNLLQEMRQQIQSLQKAKLDIGKDIILLEQTTMNLLKRKEQQIQLKKIKIQELKQENQQIQIKYSTEKYKVQQLEHEKLKYQKLIKSEHQKLKLLLQETENKHKQSIIKQKQNYESQIITLKHQKQLLKQKLQQQILSIKLSYQSILSKKDNEINQYVIEIRNQKNQIQDLKTKLEKIMTQHNNEIKSLMQKINIKRQTNKSNSQTQTLQIINYEEQNEILPHPQLLKSSIEQSQSQIQFKRYNSESDLKLTKTKTSIGQYFESQKRLQSNNEVPNLLTFSNRLNNSKQIQKQQRNSKIFSSSHISLKKINSQIKIVADYPIKNTQELNISHTIFMNLGDQQKSTNYANQKENLSYQKIKDAKKQQENNGLCFKFFITFICLWSLYFSQKLYELWNLLKA